MLDHSSENRHQPVQRKSSHNAATPIAILVGQPNGVQLVRGKTVTGDDHPVIINREDNAEAARALDRWIDLAGINPGTPVFRSIRRGGRITHDRLSPDFVARIVKRRVTEHLERLGVPPAMAQVEAKKYAAHSLRHGFATTAAEAGASTLEIASVTGHRSLDVLARYVRQAEKNAIRPSKRASVGLRPLPSPDFTKSCANRHLFAVGLIGRIASRTA